MAESFEEGPGSDQREPWSTSLVIGSVVTALVVLGAIVVLGMAASRIGAGNNRPPPAADEDARPGVSTGTESLWDVKVGTDPQARLVNQTPVATTVAWLTAQPPSTDHRVAPFELTVYSVTATLTRVHEEHDLDEHLNIQDDDGHFMIAELPAVSVAGRSVFRAGIERAHAELAAWTGDLPAKVRITGVGFFDDVTGQPDQAPNQVELHPLLDIEFLPAGT
jgi:hypothetical protein